MLAFLVLLVQFAVLGRAVAPLQVELQGIAPWLQIPFAVRLLESVASHNESLYEQTLRSVFGVSLSTNDENYDEDADVDADEIDEIDEQDDSSSWTDLDIYNRFLLQTSLSHESKSMIDFYLTYNLFGPRVASHYEYYNAHDYETLIAKKCATDSFGVPLADQGAWVQFKNEIYCSNEDLFALKTDSQDSHELEPFDRIVGKLGPIVVFYGEPSSKQFIPMLRSLLLDAEHGKLRFVFRYAPPKGGAPDLLAGYSVEFALNNLDWLQLENEKSGEVFPLGDIRNIDCSKIQTPSNAKDIGLKLASYVLGQNTTDEAKFETLRTISQSFPCFIASLSESPVDENVKRVLTYNEKKGISSKSNGFYVNGAPVNRLELDVFNVYKKIKSELETVQSLQNTGLTTVQAKYLINKFALIGAVKDSRYRSGDSLWGSNANRFRVYEQRFNPKGKSDGGVVFFNNIEEDVLYERYSKNAEEVYLGPQGMNIRMGQIPPLRENIHDLIFVINLEDKEQLKVFFSFAKVILDKGLAHQLGILPLKGSHPLDVVMARKLYSILEVSHVREALGFLYAYFATKDPEEEKKLFDSIEDSVENLDELFATANKFSINGPSIIFSGVIHSLHEQDWQLSMAQQIFHDVRVLQDAMLEGKHEQSDLKSILYENAKSERNLKIMPADPNELRYKLITDELKSKSLSIRYGGNDTHLPTTIWMIGDFTSPIMLEQLTTLLNLTLTSEYKLQLRILNTSKDDKVVEFISSALEMTEKNLRRIIEWLEIIQRDPQIETFDKNEDLLNTLEESGINIDENILLVNSRVLLLDEVFSDANIRALLEFETTYRLDSFDKIFEEKGALFNHKESVVQFMDSIDVDQFDWFDKVSSIVTNSFYGKHDILSTDVSRYDFEILDTLCSISLGNDSETQEVDLLLILDPLDEFAQEMLTVVNAFIDFSFVHVTILLQPSTDSNENQINRYVFGNMPRSKPKFNTDGVLSANALSHGSRLPGNVPLGMKLHTPRSWITTIDYVVDDIDISDFQLQNLNGELRVVFGLKTLLLEGYAKDVDNDHYPAGSVLRLTSGSVSKETTVLTTLGYFQFAVSPGAWELSINSKSNLEGYNLLNNIEGYVTSNDRLVSSISAPVYSLGGLTIYPKFTKQGKSLVPEEKKSGWSMRLLIGKFNGKKEPEINIFTVVSGPKYERLVKTMMVSVMKHTKHSVKFWILERFVSPVFKSEMSILSEKYAFEVEYVGYQWPSWLRTQKLLHREVWAYKILFLDVLFPVDLSRVIFIDADLTVRSDLYELVELDLEGAPYGFTPMCEDRDDMQQYRFWQSGYWKNVLGEKFKYHISAMFVVDLKQFRNLYVGHYLRDAYQKLSADPKSLANLDQDLPNNLQYRVPIYSLPSKWLWCESWCSAGSKKEAAIIDMCNNPASGESKLSAIARIVPEWTSLEKDVNNTLKTGFDKILHDEL